MHSALMIDEILYNIFGHCFGYGHESDADLASVARACRTFKDPALDLLWERLGNMWPLAQCLPDASYRFHDSANSEYYSFHRPLTQNEWDVLRSYTRRIRSMYVYGLDEKSLRSLWNPPIPEPLFSNVRDLHVGHQQSAVGIFNVPFPSLTTLELHALHLFNDSIETFAKTSWNLRRLTINTSFEDTKMEFANLHFLCQWQHLQSVNCYRICLDAVHLIHLSHMAALTRLYFTVPGSLPDQISPADSPLTFTNLCDAWICSNSLYLISRLLSQTLFPAVTTFSANIGSCPSRPELASFLKSQMSAIGHTVQRLYLCQDYDTSHTRVPEDGLVLSFEHLRPWGAFTHLRDIKLEFEWRVDLTDSEVLTLASTWPHLESLKIKGQWSWKIPSGISPKGLVQLLQTCPSLSTVALAINTRGDIPSSPLCLRAANWLWVDVLDSYIEADIVPIITAFFAAIMGHHGTVLCVLRSRPRAQLLDPNDLCGVYWRDVRRRVRDIVTKRTSSW